MNKNNQEAVKYLFSTYSKINNSAIKEVLKADYSSLRIDRDRPQYSELKFKRHMMGLYSLFFNQKYLVEELSKQVKEIGQSVLDVYRDLQIRLDDAIAASRGAALADKSNAPTVKTVYYSPIYGHNKDKSNAIIDGNKVIGQSINEDIVLDAKGASKISRKNIKAVLSEPNNTYQCIIKDQDNRAVDDDTALVNSNINFIVEGISQTSGRKEVELIIDRQEYVKFNNISIVTPIAYIYAIYTSNDGIYYTKINNKKILTSRLNLSLDPSVDRYVKIVVDYSSHTTSNSSGYIYRYEVEGIYIKMRQYVNEAVFESGDIEINTIGEYIAIDTCDNYQDRNVFIGYEINLDNKGWKSIKPVRKASIHQNGLKSLIPISDYLDMKVGVLTKYTEQDGLNVFDSEIPNTLINSNSFKYFDRSNIFNQVGNYVSVTGILYKDVEYDFGMMTVILNGSQVTGKVKIFSGVNKIDFPASAFKELFNINNVDSLEVESLGLYKVKFPGDDQVYTFADSNASTNAFSIAINIFGYRAILGEEITKDVKYINTDDYFKIAANTNVKKIYILTRNRMAKVENVKIRLNMRSMDTYTRPEMTRIIFRVA